MIKNDILVHFIGGGEYENDEGYTKVLPGWAYCCSGDKAMAIKEKGNTTMDANSVTCNKCWARMLKSTVLGGVDERQS